MLGCEVFEEQFYRMLSGHEDEDTDIRLVYACKNMMGDARLGLYSIQIILTMMDRTRGFFTWMI